jgi:hypothetical protein
MSTWRGGRLVSAPAAAAAIGATGQKIEDLAMAAAARFYSRAQVLFAPNPELCRCWSARRAGPAT